MFLLVADLLSAERRRTRVRAQGSARGRALRSRMPLKPRLLAVTASQNVHRFGRTLELNSGLLVQGEEIADGFRRA